MELTHTEVGKLGVLGRGQRVQVDKGDARWGRATKEV